jgi:hypothetical protein
MTDARRGPLGGREDVGIAVLWILWGAAVTWHLLLTKKLTQASGGGCPGSVRAWHDR